MAEVIYWENDSLISLTGVTDRADDSQVTGTTGTAKLLDGGGTVVSGASDITLSATSAGSNDYQGTLSSTVGIDRSSPYTLEATLESSSGLKGTWRLPVTSRIREQ